MINELVDQHRKDEELIQKEKLKEIKKQLSIQKKEERERAMNMINKSIGEKLRESMQKRTKTESSIDDITNLSDPYDSDNGDLTF